MDNTNSDITDLSPLWHGTGASINLRGVRLVLLDQASPLSEMMPFDISF